MTKHKLIEFGKKVLRDEGIENVTIKVTEKDNFSYGGYYHKDTGIIEIRDENISQALMLHEITHTKYPNHCSKEFMQEYRRLCEKYKVEYGRDIHIELFNKWYGAIE